MKMGDHMQEVVDLVNGLTDGDTDASLKLLALVVGEYMINADALEMSVDAGVMRINVEIIVQAEG